MKLRIISIATLLFTSAAFGMGHDPRPLQRALAVIKHLIANPPAITYGTPPGIQISPDVVIGKHKHLFNLICAKVIGAID